MKLPWVSRELYALALRARDVEHEVATMLRHDIVREHERVDQLVHLVATMRRDGFTAAKPRAVIEREDVEVVTKRRAEDQFIDRARAQFMAETGVDIGTATREAERLRRDATDLQPTSASDG